MKVIGNVIIRRSAYDFLFGCFVFSSYRA